MLGGGWRVLGAGEWPQPGRGRSPPALLHGAAASPACSARARRNPQLRHGLAGAEPGLLAGRDGAGEGRRRLPPAFLGWPSAAAERLALITAPKELERCSKQPRGGEEGRGAARGAQAAAPRRLPAIRRLGVPNLASCHPFPNVGSSPGRAGTQRGSRRHPNAFHPAAPSAAEPPARRKSPIPPPLTK